MSLSSPQAPCDRGLVQLDDAYLGGERAGGKVGRGSENKVPFVAALSVSQQGSPLFVKLTLVKGFTTASIKAWAVKHLAPDAKSCLTAWPASAP